MILNVKTARIISAISITLNISLITVLFTPITKLLYQPLIIDEAPKKSESIVILSAGAYQSGLPDFGTLVRLRKGLELYRSGWAEWIICAGGVWYPSIKKSIAELMKDTLILYGVAADRILTQDETINSYNDITFLMKKFQNRFNFHKTLFVTSSYHTYRVKKILESQSIRARVISADSWELQPESWVERFQLFKKVCREYGAIVYFKIKGWI